jgi:hypothetical protein
MNRRREKTKTAVRLSSKKRNVNRRLIINYLFKVKIINCYKSFLFLLIFNHMSTEIRYRFKNLNAIQWKL